MRNTALGVAWLVAAIFCSGVDAAERPRRGEKRAEARVVEAPEIVWSIIYDTGTNVGFHPDATGGNSNRVVGNRFNSALGAPLLMTHMVDRITVFPANSGAQSVSIATAPTTMGTAMVLDFFNANLMANVFNAIAVDPALTLGPDFLGFFIGVYGAQQPMGLLGMSDMSLNGQGFHAVQGFYAGSMLASMIQTVPGRNAMLRVRTDMLPVELMDFTLE